MVSEAFDNHVEASVLFRLQSITSTQRMPCDASSPMSSLPSTFLKQPTLSQKERNLNLHWPAVELAPLIFERIMQHQCFEKKTLCVTGAAFGNGAGAGAAGCCLLLLVCSVDD